MDKTSEQPKALDSVGRERRDVGLQGVGVGGPFAGLLDLQRAAGNRAVGQFLQTERHGGEHHRNMQRSSGRAATAPDTAAQGTIQRSPAPGWDPGWAKDSPVASGGMQKSTTTFTSGPNAGATTIGTIRRIPIDFVAGGNQEASMRDRYGGPVHTKESAVGRAIILIPTELKTDRPVDILLHLHGMNEGYRSSGGTTRDADPNLDNLERQLQDSKRPQMLAVLPQGTTQAKFGVGTGASQSMGFDSDAYIKETFTTLAFMGIWLAIPPVGQVVLSAHSGGGGGIGEQMLAGKDHTSAPTRMTELVLFDAINGPKEVAGVVAWINQQLDRGLTALTRTGIKPDEQAAYLASSMRFRGYHTGPAQATPNDAVTAGYANRYAVVEKAINDWFKAHAAQLGGATAPAYQGLRANFTVAAVGHDVHDAVVGRGDHLRDEISALAPTTQGQSVFRKTDGLQSAEADASIPSSVGTTLQTPGRPVDPATRSLMEARLAHDFSNVRLHTDPQAATSARAVHALAYTVGRDVVFAAGQYNPQTEQGQHLLAHELTHVIQQSGAAPAAEALTLGPAGDRFEQEAEHVAAQAGPLHSHETRATSAVQRAPQAARPLTTLHPEDAATYEEWLATFANLPTFTARDTTATGTHPTGFDVLGQKAAPVRDDPTAAEGDRPPNPNPLATTADHFIDRPTDTWVKANLPDNLRETAYRLPADCADVAVILRHVWLSAHHRTETYNGWVVGDLAGGPAAERVRKLIVNEVSSQSVQAMVNAYSDAQGTPLRTFAALQPLLHAGDVLVWEHHSAGFGTARTGGHTQTISEVKRDAAGNVTELVTLQGNQPLSAPQATEIRAEVGAKAPSEKELRAAPGRRIERESLRKDPKNPASGDLRDFTPPATNPKHTPQPIWTWSDGHTTLVVAGAPKAAARPVMQTQGGVRRRRLADWLPQLQNANQQTLYGTVEAALQEARAAMEGGQTVTDDEVRALALAAGERVFSLSQQTSDPQHRNFAPLQQMQTINDVRAIIRALGRGDATRSTTPGRNAAQDTVRRLFGLAEDVFHLAARGATSIDFTRKVPSGTRIVRVLVTGFDPFNVQNAVQPARPRDWNPSGAAVLALDHTTVPVSKGVVAAVEGIILPVDFDAFRAGLVERIVQPLATARGVDAVITVSEDPGIAPGSAVRLEQFSVGVHRLNNNVLEGVPAAGSAGAGAPLIRTAAPLSAIADDTARAAAPGKTAIPRPTIGTAVTFSFGSALEASRAAKALGQAVSNQTEVEVSDPGLLQQIMSTMTRSPGSTTDISFKIAGQRFQATVVAGPGGNFLSNEVAFRVQRLLGSAPGTPAPPSFHVHTQRGTAAVGAEVPQDAAGLGAASQVRTTLITTLQRTIKAVADRLPIP